MADAPPREEYLTDARAWLAANATPRPERVERSWGEGSDSVAPGTTPRPSTDRWRRAARDHRELIDIMQAQLVELGAAGQP
jgi:hypothetical protein